MLNSVPRPALERMAGIEPAYSGWKPDILPLNYTRLSFHGRLVGEPGLEPG